MANATVVYSEGDMKRTVLYRLHGVTTNDTVDVAAQFSKITIATLVPVSVDIPNFPSTTPFTGKVINIVQVGLINEAMYMLVCGSAA